MTLAPGVRRFFDRRYWRHYYHSKPSEIVEARIARCGTEATVHYGSRSFFVRGPEGIIEDHTAPDFAVIGLAVISMSQNIEIRVSMPVSIQAAEMVENLAHAFRLWMMPKIAPLRIRFDKVVSPPRCTTTGDKVLCLSGGVDSIFGAIEAITIGGFTHSLLIAGADYPTAETPGFRELKERVHRQSARLGLELLVVASNLKAHRMKWAMLHSLVLAMSLHYLSSRFSSGGLAMDNTPAQDLARYPWGNSAALADMLGTKQFPIAALGGSLDRVQKLKAIANHDPSLLQDLSVCYKDKSQGGNCGICSKCIRTRLGFVCVGIDQDLAFPTDTPLETLIERLPIPSKTSGLRGTLIRTSELTRYLPKGGLRTKVEKYENRILKRLLRSAPHG